MLNVQVLGLVYFDGCAADKKRALAPNGTQAENGIPPHFASLFILPDQLIKDDWWESFKLPHTIAIPSRSGTRRVSVDVIEFRIPEPAEIVFPDQNGKQAECVRFGGGLPKLQDLDSKFQIFANPDTIAKVTIRGGTLQACQFDGNSRAVQWTMATAGEPIEIQVLTAKETKTVKLKNLDLLPPQQAQQIPTGALGTEVVFSNTTNLIETHHPHDQHEHFELYKKIGAPFNPTQVVGPPQGLPELETDHAYLNHLKMHNEVPGPGCTPSCCAR